MFLDILVEVEFMLFHIFILAEVYGIGLVIMTGYHFQEGLEVRVSEDQNIGS